VSAEPVALEEDRSRYAGVLRFYDLAKHAEWQVADVPWGALPPVPEGKGSPQRQARRRDIWRSVVMQQLQADIIARLSPGVTVARAREALLRHLRTGEELMVRQLRQARGGTEGT